MHITVETLQMQLARLKQRLAECPAPDETAELEIQHILQTAPQILDEAERGIQSGNPLLLQHVHEMLNETGAFIEWAVGSVKGQIHADTMRRKEEIDPALPADERLLDRITRCLLSKVDRATYTPLIREFAGDNAVQGDTVYMDPVGEAEAFSQWLIHDIPLPGEKQRLIEFFAQEESSNLPADEQRLLQLYLQDRPSIYRVMGVLPDRQGPDMQGVYSVKDMLSENETLHIWDVSTSKTLQQDALFIGRAIPVDAKIDNLFTLMGTVIEIPPKFWDILSASITAWSEEYFAGNQSSTSRDFFRAHHARIQRKIVEITEGHATRKPQRPKNVKISSMKTKTASDIHTFFKRNFKKDDGYERLVQHPDALKYMNKFKRLMDTSSHEEMDYLSNRFSGFYRFGKMLESLATAIERGDI